MKLPSIHADPLSGSGSGMRLSATVKRYDPAKGYGLLAPVDGPPDIICRGSALAAVGLDTLLAGATVSCEAVQGRRGPEVSRILAVDFSTASPGAATPAPAAVDGRTPVAPGAGQASPAAGDRTVRALVKWFHPGKGYGFLEPEDGSDDVFCHLTAVQASGRDTLPRGATVTCEIVVGDRSPQVSRILSVAPPPDEPAPADRGRAVDTRFPGPNAEAALPADGALPGTVKFFDPARGFGFVTPDEGSREVFVHSSVLFRSGMTGLAPGQRVLVRAESAPRGLQATDIEPL